MRLGGRGPACAALPRDACPLETSSGPRCLSGVALRAASRVFLGVLGAVAVAILFRSTGCYEAIDRHGLAWVIDEGFLGGLFVMALSIGVACWVTTSRSPVRAGLALGCVAPSAWAASLDPEPASCIIWCVVAALCAGIAWRAVRRSPEPAALRLAVTSAGVAALLVCSLATMLWWPWSFPGAVIRWTPPFRVLPTPHVAIATLLLIVSVFDLRARRTRALLWIAAAGACLALAPHLGEVQRGCFGRFGLFDALMFPRSIVPIVLAFWVPPVARFFLDRPR